MLISMPTGTSTILGVFQVIPSSKVVWRRIHAGAEPRSTPDIAQVRRIDGRTPIFRSWTTRLLFWTILLARQRYGSCEFSRESEQPFSSIEFQKPRLPARASYFRAH